MNPFLKRLATDIPLMSADHFMWMMGATLDDVELAEHPVFKKMREQLKPKAEMRGQIAILPIQGTLAYNPHPMEMVCDDIEDSREVLSMLRSANMNPDVKGVLLRMDTPGGMLLGGPEMADEVADMKRTKPVVAHIGGMGASLGYLIASQASEVYANKSAIVGSIGVIAKIPDYSALLAKIGVKFDVFTNAEAKFKAAGTLGTSLSNEQRQHFQDSVQSVFETFKSSVLSARPGVNAEAMQGQTFRGSESKSMGLIDGVGSEEYALAVLQSKIR